MSYSSKWPYFPWQAGAEARFLQWDIQSYFISTFATILVAEVNGHKFGKFYNTTNNDRHAEDNFMINFNEKADAMAQASILRGDRTNEVNVYINNSPCKRCAERIAEWLGINNGEYGANLELTFFCANAYGAKDPNTLHALHELSMRNDVILDWWNITLEASQSGIDLDRMLTDKEYKARLRKTGRSTDFFAKLQ